MIYLSGCIRHDVSHPMLGFIHVPRRREALPDGCIWAADNGRFSAPWEYTDEAYLRWLGSQDRERCLFATAPDVLADHMATVELSRPLFPHLRALGYRAAFVAQDGWQDATTPWDEFDVLFLGGTTSFKLGVGANAIASAQARGKATHMGRVNSFTRLRVAAAMGCDSADGTYLKFGPDINTPKMLAWLDRLQVNEMLPFHARTL
jgi:hypothetical protein